MRKVLSLYFPDQKTETKSLKSTLSQTIKLVNSEATVQTLMCCPPMTLRASYATGCLNVTISYHSFSYSSIRSFDQLLLSDSALCWTLGHSRGSLDSWYVCPSECLHQSPQNSAQGLDHYGFHGYLFVLIEFLLYWWSISYKMVLFGPMIVTKVCFLVSSQSLQNGGI